MSNYGKYQGYMTHNPPSPIERNGMKFYTRNTFKTRSEAMEELRDVKDHYKKGFIEKFYEGYVVYEEP